MKANELRTENLVKAKPWNNEILTVNFIDNKQTINKISIGFKEKEVGCFIEDVIPIPLTEEWLLKLGYKKGDNNNRGQLFENWLGGFYLKDGLLKPKPYYFDNAFSETLEIKYVHQLQNIHFALTGEEL